MKVLEILRLIPPDYMVIIYDLNYNLQVVTSRKSDITYTDYFFSPVRKLECDDKVVLLKVENPLSLRNHG